MSVNLSPVGGAGAQFCDNNGNPLNGGKLYTYGAGTTTPAATYTSAAGSVFHTNPIVLNAGGRVPDSGEIWLADNISYKFVLKTSADVLIATWDNINGINSNFVNYTVQEEVITATAGQTVFDLTTITYAPATNSLAVYIDGVNQIVDDSYIETDSNTVTFVSGLHDGALVKFTTAVPATGTATNAAVVTYDPAGTGAVPTTVQAKLRETVSVKDFGAVGDGVTDDSVAIQAAINAAASVYFPSGNYICASQIVVPATCTNIYGEGAGNTVLTYTREQTSSSRDDNSFFFIDGVDGFRATKLKLVYTGSFYDPDPTKLRAVDGLRIKNCSKVYISEVEATGFNSCGIVFTGDTTETENTATNCNLHHNRIAGCLITNQKMFTIDGCYLAYNGYVSDGGTGYGFAVDSSASSDSVMVVNNTTDHNYRKGLDAHNGINITISDNICRGDRLYGIAYQNGVDATRSVVISNNIIEHDPSFYLLNDDNLGTGVYNFFQAIAINMDDVADMAASFTITGNSISQLSADDATIVLKGIYLRTLATTRLVTVISDNVIRGGNIEYGIQHFATSAAGSAELLTDIHDNTIVVGDVAENLISVDPYSDAGGPRGYCNIVGNTLRSITCVKQGIFVGNGYKSTIVNNNTVAVTTATTKAITVESNGANAKVAICNNAYEVTTGFSGSKFTYGRTQNVTFLNNTYESVNQGDVEKITTLNGTTSRIKGYKSLSAATDTDIVRFGYDETAALYVVKWSASNVQSGDNAVVGGIITFSASQLSGSSARSTIATVATNSVAGGAATPITVSFSLATQAVDSYQFKLKAQANLECDFYFDMEMIASEDQGVETVYPVL